MATETDGSRLETEGQTMGTEDGRQTMATETEHYLVWVGHYEHRDGHREEDGLLPVEFDGSRLGTHTDYVWDRAHGVTETLYRTSDGRLVVHLESWTPDTDDHELILIGEADLQIGEQFEHLGRHVGYAPALTVDEALALNPRHSR